MTSGRFSFPNAVLVAVKDTSTHEVEVIKITEDGNVFFCDMLRRAGLSFEGSFLIASVKDADGNFLWKFADSNHAGLGLLAETTKGAVIALCGAGKRAAVERVIPLKSMVQHQQPDVATVMMMKSDAGKYLDREYVLTGVESKMFVILAARRKEAEAAAQAAAEAERQRRREQRVEAILAREPLLETAVGGSRRSGVPVVEAEWQMLPGGTRAILVDRIDENGQIGNPLQAFVVTKVPGKNPIKANVAKLVQYAPTTLGAKSQIPQPLYSVLAERNGVFHEVQIYEHMDTIRQARATGLNSGTMVAVKPEDGKTLEVFAVRTDEVQTVGKFIVV